MIHALGGEVTDDRDNPEDPEDYPTKYSRNLHEWERQSEMKSINRCRELCGLEPITYHEINCSNCGRLFIGQFKGSKKIVHFCRDCSYNISRREYGDLRLT